MRSVRLSNRVIGDALGWLVIVGLQARRARDCALCRSPSGGARFFARRIGILGEGGSNAGEGRMDSIRNPNPRDPKEATGIRFVIAIL
jgi:hypothetical protein